MKGLTKSQLLEYVSTKRDICLKEWKANIAAGNTIMADKILQTYFDLNTIYLCMTDNDFARQSYHDWTGKEL